MFEGPNPGRQRAVLLVVAVGYFLIQIGMTQVTPIVPTISASLGVDTSLGSWVLAGYTMFLGVWVLIAGRAGDLYGHGRVYCLGMTILTVATLGCGFAADVWQLIVFRCVQGFGGALVLASGFPILRATFPERVQGRAIGIVLAVTAFGATFGVLLGTALVEAIGWRPLFLSLVPVTALATAGAFAALPGGQADRPPAATRLDLAGAALLFVALAALSLSFSHLHEGAETFASGWSYHTAMEGVSLVCFVLFVRHERRTPNPIVPLHHLRNGLFMTAVGINFILHMVMAGTMFAMAFVVEWGLGLSTGQVGHVQSSLYIPVLVFSLLGGWLYDRTRSLVLRPLGMALLGSMLAFLAVFGPSLPYVGFFFVVAALGAALGGVNSVNNTVIMTALSLKDRGFSAGMLESSRQLGHTFAVAIASALLSFGNPGGLFADVPVSWVGFQANWWTFAAFAGLPVVLSLARRRMPTRAAQTVAVAGET